MSTSVGFVNQDLIPHSHPHSSSSLPSHSTPYPSLPSVLPLGGKTIIQKGVGLASEKMEEIKKHPKFREMFVEQFKGSILCHRGSSGELRESMLRWYESQFEVPSGVVLDPEDKKRWFKTMSEYPKAPCMVKVDTAGTVSISQGDHRLSTFAAVKRLASRAPQLSPAGGKVQVHHAFKVTKYGLPLAVSIVHTAGVESLNGRQQQQVPLSAGLAKKNILL